MILKITSGGMQLEPVVNFPQFHFCESESEKCEKTLGGLGNQIEPNWKEQKKGSMESCLKLQLGILTILMELA